MFTLSWLPNRFLDIMNWSNGLLDARYLRTFYSSPLNVVYFTMMLMSRQCFFLGIPGHVRHGHICEVLYSQALIASSESLSRDKIGGALNEMTKPLKI